jgi:hypothetical protein
MEDWGKYVWFGLLLYPQKYLFQIKLGADRRPLPDVKTHLH